VGLALTRYGDALEFLFARTTGKTKFGLERTRELLHALGDPHERFRTLHVGGTNGKGSVCATLEAMLRAQGLRVGKYTSPHLVDFRERILVDGRPVSEECVVEFIDRWTPLCERLGATFFEATTAMAFDHLARSEVDVGVIEVGLGGRLDSTNVITPLAAGVVSIGFDHMEFLGETKEAIAREKAGIFKAGVPALIGERDPAIRELLAREARAAGAEPVVVAAEAVDVADVAVDAEGTSFTLTDGRGRRRLRTPLAGAHQAGNAALALAMLHAAGGDLLPDPEVEHQALARVRLPGRFHRVGKYVFDVAHNPDGAAVLARTLRAVSPRRPVAALLSVLGDKDWRAMMSELAPVVDCFVLTTAPTAPASRAWRLEAALAYARERGWTVDAEGDFDLAVRRAEALGATVLVTGSFHTAGDAMARLQIDPLQA
jgi:dihydrofolate synthase / folylpolyglutamate synthase